MSMFLASINPKELIPRDMVKRDYCTNYSTSANETFLLGNGMYLHTIYTIIDDIPAVPTVLPGKPRFTLYKSYAHEDTLILVLMDTRVTNVDFMRVHQFTLNPQIFTKKYDISETAIYCVDSIDSSICDNTIAVYGEILAYGEWRPHSELLGVHLIDNIHHNIFRLTFVVSKNSFMYSVGELTAMAGVVPENKFFVNNSTTF